MIFKRIKDFIFRQKSDALQSRHIVVNCPDCGVGSGGLHDLFCTKERCPFCGAQLITCTCISTVLKLSEEEQLAVDEYIDDSTPPLSDIMERWKEALLRKGRIPFEEFGDDPIRCAYRGDLDAFKRFLDDGYLPNSSNEVGYTALMGAARGEQHEMIQFLLSHGWKAQLPDRRGMTALHWAVAQSASDPARQVACISALLNAGSDPNARTPEGGTPLIGAAWFGNGDAVKHLLHAGANPSLTDNNGRTAKDLATTRCHLALAEMLE